MARAGLDWRAQDLADNSGVARITIARFESGSNIAPESIQKLRIAFATAGVGFIDRGHYKYGVYVGEREN